MTKTNLSSIIDAWGQLKAQQAKLAAEEKALKAAVAELEPGSYEGELFKLSITMPERAVRDDEFKAAIDALIEASFSRQYVTAHTTTEVSRTHTVRARNGKGVAP
jgi:hypothetical protein